MGRPALVIVNPAAGGGRSERLWPRLRDSLGRLGLRFDHVLTGGPGDAVHLARGAADAAVPLVVAVGGDGTLNEVVNGVTSPDGCPRATVGVMMTGRGRDAGRNLGLPRDPLAAVRRVVAGGEILVDLGCCEWPGGRRFFVNAAGVGFDAAVAAGAAALGGGGTIPYLRAVLQALGSYHPVRLDLAGDGLEGLGGPAAAVVVANGRHFGGGMRIAPAADPADGLLDLVFLGALGRAELILWLPTLYWGGHVRNRKVTLRRVREARITGPSPVGIEMDGEPVGRTPVTIRVHPRALRLRL